jgi:TolB-like protein
MTDEANQTGSAPPEDFLSTAWRRVKEHRIAQWTVGYVAVAYGIQHAITLTSEAFEWPNTVIRVSMLLLGLGLPVAMTLAWYHGERASRRISAGELSILSVLLVIASLLFYTLVRPAPAIQEAGVTAARQASLSPGTAISLAVMPFDNLSPDPDQGDFVDGMGVEIIAALAKIPDLRVIGRESALEFKGKHPNFRDAGKALNATHLLEGSVRKKGDELRISAELVRADTGATVWANTYDRELKDVWEVQEDIARSIAASMHMTLGLKPGENLVSNRIDDEKAHELYLKGHAAFRLREIPEAEQAVKELLDRAPNFAPGLALQAKVLWNRGTFGGGGSQLVEQAVVVARKAISFDSGLAAAHVALGQALVFQGKFAEAAEELNRARALDSNDPEVIAFDFNFRLVFGYLKQALELSDKLLQIEPLVPIYTRNAGVVQIVNGLTDAGVRTIELAGKQAQAVSGATNVGAGYAAALSMAYSQQGRYREAADTLLKANAGPGGRNRENLTAAAAVLNALADGRKPPARLQDFDSSLNFVYAAAGEPARMLEWSERSNGLNPNLWLPMLNEVRKTERFKKLMRDKGLVAFWHKNDWPDLCKPKPGDDFECS